MRKELKRAARQNVKQHYWLLLVLCLAAAVLGSAFANTLDLFHWQAAEIMETPRLLSNMGFSEIIDNVLEQNGVQLDYSWPNALYRYAFSPTRGVLAEVVNTATSGQISGRIVQMVNSVVHSTSLASDILTLLFFLVYFVFWFYIQNTYRVMYTRSFLEGRMYKRIPLRRLMFLKDSGTWTKASLTMAYTALLQALWLFTIVGGVIKSYSYFLVPYIAAENPHLGASETVNLSRRMMKGHKWECFLLDMSFLGWRALGVASLGLANLFYVNSYTTATFCNYYALLREKARAHDAKIAEALNDTYLFERATEAVLVGHYGEPAVRENPLPALKGFRKFCAEVLGISLYDDETERAYREAEQLAVKEMRRAGERGGEMYPELLSPLCKKARADSSDGNNFMRHYSFFSVHVMFLFFSVVGWTWELCIHYIAEGEFVNRGMLHGPLEPIYGAGAVFMLMFLYRVRKKPWLEFLLSMVVCGLLEYLASYFMELGLGMRWWDYTGYFLNLNGRICAESLLTFGVAGAAFVYVIAPRFDDVLTHIRRKLGYRATAIACAVVTVVFAADLIYSCFVPNSGRGITDDAPTTSDVQNADEPQYEPVSLPRI